MFGTLRIASRRLDPTERAAYRAAFCTACHALTALGGRPAALLTNYDQTMLAVVLAGLGSAGRRRLARPCTALPWRTVAVDDLPPAANALLAALDVAAVTAKLTDDVEDARSLRARIGLRLLRGLDRRARAQLTTLGFPLSIFDQLADRQRRVEDDADATIDELAAPSAELTAQIFAHAAVATDRRAHGAALAQLGAALGAFVYGLDAWQDRRRDRRRGEFNGWQHVHGDRVDGPEVADWLAGQLAIARDAVAALPGGEFRQVLTALLDSAADRLPPIAATGARDLRRDLREAGDCDLPCCSIDCGSCGDDSCSLCGGAAEAVDAGAESTRTDSSWIACLCCDPYCPTDARRESRAERRSSKRRTQSPDPAALSRFVGERAKAVTDLQPDGRVEIDGAQFDAIFEGILAAAGETLVVIRIANGRLVVGRANDR